MVRRGSAVVALVLVVCACTAPQPTQPPREETMAPATPVVRSATHPLLRGTWRFDQDAAACVATLAAGRDTLTISVRRNVPVRLALALGEPAPATARLRFTGNSGNWQIGAQRAGDRSLGATLGADTIALSRVLVLLGGGTLDVGEAEQGLPAISVPAAGGQGQTWFDCSRDKLS
jgi:hypothetical protein